MGKNKNVGSKYLLPYLSLSCPEAVRLFLNNRVLDATLVISDWWLKDLEREFEEIRNVFKYAVSLAKAYALINNCIRNFSLCDLKPCFDEFSLLESAAQDRNKRKTTCNIEKLESIWIELELIQKALLFFMWCFTVTEI